MQAPPGESALDMQTERMRSNRWLKTLDKIEQFGGRPKLKLDDLDNGPGMWKPMKKLKRSLKLSSTEARKKIRRNEQVLEPHEFKRYLSVEYDASQDNSQAERLKPSNIPSFRRISSFIGKKEGFTLLEDSVFARSDSFDKYDSLVNPSTTMNRALSFKSARSGEMGTLFDFSTVNQAQEELILGALPPMPPKPQPIKDEDKKEEGEESKDGKDNEDEEGKDKNEEQGENDNEADEDETSGSGSRSQKSQEEDKEEVS
mmetsp:Transcript_3031/g.4644  ORF Transcript_3031/g.4644 Transcript_3031/m.4644 type:complete len:258 (-) Transcript_3031:12-785(-)